MPDLENERSARWESVLRTMVPNGMHSRTPSRIAIFSKWGIGTAERVANYGLPSFGSDKRHAEEGLCDAVVNYIQLPIFDPHGRCSRSSNDGSRDERYSFSSLFFGELALAQHPECGPVNHMGRCCREV